MEFKYSGKGWYLWIWVWFNLPYYMYNGLQLKKDILKILHKGINCHHSFMNFFISQYSYLYNVVWYMEKLFFLNMVGQVDILYN